VGAADLDDIGELDRLGVQRVPQGPDRRHQTPGDLLDGRDVHRRRERVVRRLRHVDVVVGVDGGLRAELAAGQLDGPVRDHLVHVHVRLGAAAGLPDEQRELVVELTGDHLVGGPDDEVRRLGAELAEILVGERRRLLEDGHAADHGPGHAVVADREVVQRALGLRTPVPMTRDVDRPHAVALGAGRFACRVHVTRS
jgi:hypothetical protein